LSVALSEAGDGDRGQSSTSTTAPGSNLTFRPESASTISLQSGWCPTTTTVPPRPTVPDFWRQVGQRHHPALGGHDGALDGVLQLADVAGPVERLERQHRLVVDGPRSAAGALAALLQEVQHQLGHVLEA